MRRRIVEVDGVQHIVMAHDRGREEYFVSASDNAHTGAFYLCSIRAGRWTCTCRRGQFGFGHSRGSGGSGGSGGSRPYCRHVEAALRASVAAAAEELATERELARQDRGGGCGPAAPSGAMGPTGPTGPRGLPDPFV